MALAVCVTLPASAQIVTGDGSGALVRLGVPFEPAESRPASTTGGDLPTATFTFRSGDVESVAVWVDRDPCRDEGIDGQHDALDLTLAVTRRGVTSHWNLASPAVAPDLCDRESWGVADRDDETFDLGSAATDLPVIRLAYRATWSRNARHDQLVIDARAPRPVLVARLEASTSDAWCADNPPTRVDCTWQAREGDFACQELLLTRNALVRHSWLTTGTTIARPDPSAPANAAAWLSLARGPIVGTWADTPDLGPVRLIAEVPSRQRGRRILLLGASEAVGRPLFVVTLDRSGTRVTPIVVGALTDQLTLPDVDVRSMPLSLDGYLPAEEPPQFTVRALLSPRPGLRVLLVASSPGRGRRPTVFHVGLEDTRDGVVADALRVATDPGEDPALILDTNESSDVCAATYVPGFARLLDVNPVPLALTYDVEPPFRLSASHGGPYRDAADCTVRTTARWRNGRGFEFDEQQAACSATTFRVAVVRPDGSLAIATRTRPPGAELR